MEPVIVQCTEISQGEDGRASYSGFYLKCQDLPVYWDGEGGYLQALATQGFQYLITNDNQYIPQDNSSKPEVCLQHCLQPEGTSYLVLDPATKEEAKLEPAAAASVLPAFIYDDREIDVHFTGSVQGNQSIIWTTLREKLLDIASQEIIDQIDKARAEIIQSGQGRREAFSVMSEAGVRVDIYFDGTTSPARTALEINTEKDNPERLEAHRAILRGVHDSIGSQVFFYGLSSGVYFLTLNNRIPPYIHAARLVDELNDGQDTNQKTGFVSSERQARKGSLKKDTVLRATAPDQKIQQEVEAEIRRCGRKVPGIASPAHSTSSKKNQRQNGSQRVQPNQKPSYQYKVTQKRDEPLPGQHNFQNELRKRDVPLDVLIRNGNQSSQFTFDTLKKFIDAATDEASHEETPWNIESPLKLLASSWQSESPASRLIQEVEGQCTMRIGLAVDPKSDPPVSWNLEIVLLPQGLTRWNSELLKEAAKIDKKNTFFIHWRGNLVLEPSGEVTGMLRLADFLKGNNEVSTGYFVTRKPFSKLQQTSFDITLKSGRYPRASIEALAAECKFKVRNPK